MTLSPVPMALEFFSEETFAAGALGPSGPTGRPFQQRARTQGVRDALQAPPPKDISNAYPFRAYSEARGGPAAIRAVQFERPRTTMFSVTLATNRDQLAEMLPERFEVGEEPTVTVSAAYMTDVPWLAGRGYNTLGVTFPAVFNGERGRRSGRFPGGPVGKPCGPHHQRKGGASVSPSCTASCPRPWSQMKKPAVPPPG